MERDVLGFLKTTLGIVLNVPADDIDPDADLLAVTGADSLDIVELLTAADREFDCYLPDDQLIRAQTLRDIARLYEDHLQGDDDI